MKAKELPITVDVRCPHCKRVFVSVYDMGDLVSGRAITCSCGWTFSMKNNLVENEKH